MEVVKQRNRTVRRYHRSMKTGEVLPCVAVREEDCRAEHLTERQAFEASKERAHELTKREQEKEAKKAESRRRRRAAQTAYMRKWRERRALKQVEVVAEAGSSTPEYMALIPDVPASWFVATVPDDERRGLVARVEAVDEDYAQELRGHLLELPPLQQLAFMTVGEMVTCFEENKDWAAEDASGTVSCLGRHMDLDQHSDFVQSLNDVLFEMEGERLAAGIDITVAHAPELLSEALVETLERADVWVGLDDLYAKWQSSGDGRQEVSAHDFVVEHLEEYLDEAQESETAV